LQVLYINVLETEIVQQGSTSSTDSEPDSFSLLKLGPLVSQLACKRQSVLVYNALQ